MSTNVDLTERLLNPETVEEALKEFGAEWQYKTVVRELHERLKTAKAEGAAEAQRYKAAHELWTRAEADLAAAREEIARRAEDTARMDAVENLKLTVQHRSGITASVHPWMVRGDVGAWTGRSAREVVDAARAGGTR